MAQKFPGTRLSYFEPYHYAKAGRHAPAILIDRFLDLGRATHMEGGESTSDANKATVPESMTPVARETLYAEVWAEPMTVVAARYGVSSSYMARVCRRLNVPRPVRGYWARLAVGKAGRPPSLPPVRPEDELEWSREGGLTRAAQPLPKPPVLVPKRHARPRAQRPSQHPLVVGAMELFCAGRESDSGFLKPSKKLLIDLVVSKGALPRALQIANDLFLLLEERGHRVMIAPQHQHFQRCAVDEREKPSGKRGYVDLWAPIRQTIAYIGTVAVGVTIFEISEEVEVRWVNGKFIPVRELELPRGSRHSPSSSWTTKKDLPSGRLCIQVYSPYHRTKWMRQWREEKAATLTTRSGRLLKT